MAKLNPIAIRVDAGNDTNGNPRRLFLVYDTQANLVDIIKEGYNGSRQLEELYPSLRGKVTGLIEVSPSFYNDLIRGEYFKMATEAGASRKPWPKYKYAYKNGKRVS